MQSIELRTGIWYNDHAIHLDFPDSWDVQVSWPQTPDPLSDEQIKQTLETPIGQPPLRELAKGKKHPCIVTDDLSRPTPVLAVMPHILRHFADAGIEPEDILIVVGTGTHGNQDMDIIENKLGKEAMRCNVIVHDDLSHTTRIGKTSFGTPVYVNNEILKCDMVVGVGGVYPQHTTGFGGGGKLALGVLGRRSIMGLHYTHMSQGGTYNIDNDFRRDVTEMSKIMGLDTHFTLHVNAYMQVVSLMVGDHYSYYPQAAEFSYKRYLITPEKEADVVIANAYPLDISYVFMRKGFKTLVAAHRSAMKIMIASAYEGVGHHGLFQHMSPPAALRLRIFYRKIAVKGFVGIMKKIPVVLFRKIRGVLGLYKEDEDESSQPSIIPSNTNHLWVYRTIDNEEKLQQSDDMTVLHEWQQVIDAIKKKNPKENLKVRIYPCSPLQTVDI